MTARCFCHELAHLDGQLYTDLADRIYTTEELDAMLEGFKYLPAGTRHTVPEGGLFVWAELPEGMDAKALLDRCVENNVAYVPGTFFYVEGGHENTMRLNFSNATIEDIDKGMRALGAALAQ